MPQHLERRLEASIDHQLHYLWIAISFPGNKFYFINLLKMFFFFIYELCSFQLVTLFL